LYGASLPPALSSARSPANERRCWLIRYRRRAA
jgi:hypothetical protein